LYQRSLEREGRERERKRERRQNMIIIIIFELDYRIRYVPSNTSYLSSKGNLEPTLLQKFIVYETILFMK